MTLRRLSQTTVTEKEGRKENRRSPKLSTGVEARVETLCPECRDKGPGLLPRSARQGCKTHARMFDSALPKANKKREAYPMSIKAEFEASARPLAGRKMRNPS